MAKKKATTKSEVKIKEEVEGLTNDEMQRLRKMNLWLALAFGVQAIAVLLFGGGKTVPVTAQFLSVDQLASDSNGHQVLAAATRHLFDIRVTALAAIFLALFGLACLAMATVGRSLYEAQLARGSNMARWIGFSLGASFIVVALAAAGGVSDIATFMLMIVLTVVGFSLTPLAEKFKRARAGTVVPHALCGAALASAAAPWVLMAIGILGALVWDGHIASPTYVLYGTSFVLFACWALASHFRVRDQGKWANVLYAEKMYMFLTLAVGTVVAWQIFAGAL
ncbi:MAG TPA: heliorhodopsin HeR [Candidatus Saccharimonadales bacterium]|nr:heliorhodopsin HeR [Candidatus Saccharimonadales bacterium]